MTQEGRSEIGRLCELVAIQQLASLILIALSQSSSLTALFYLHNFRIKSNKPSHFFNFCHSHLNAPQTLPSSFHRNLSILPFFTVPLTLFPVGNSGGGSEETIKGVIRMWCSASLLCYCFCFSLQRQWSRQWPDRSPFSATRFCNKQTLFNIFASAICNSDYGVG